MTKELFIINIEYKLETGETISSNVDDLLSYLKDVEYYAENIEDESNY